MNQINMYKMIIENINNEDMDNNVIPCEGVAYGFQSMLNLSDVIPSQSK
jgi:hypothetical protein